jgi:hypothetical protein
MSAAQLRLAATIKEKIVALENELAGLVGGSVQTAVGAPTRRNNISAAGRAKIAAAQRARWAKQKGQTKVDAKPAKKRTMSAAGRAKIIAAQKARWAKVRAAKAGKK